MAVNDAVLAAREAGDSFIDRGLGALAMHTWCEGAHPPDFAPGGAGSLVRDGSAR